MYGPEIAAGKTKGFRVPPPHEGACQGGYGNVWLTLDWDSLDGPLTDALHARAVGVNWKGEVFPLFGNDGSIFIGKIPPTVALPTGIAKVSVTNYGEIVDKDGKVRKNDDVVITTMIEAEVKGVPAR